jgi:hypothetical protein
VKGSLLRAAVERAEGEHEAELIDCDVSAYNPRIQRTLLDLGFLPAAYVPGMVFHQTSRWDVVRMIKLNVPWDLGRLELTDSGRAVFDLVAPAFIRADVQRARKQLCQGAGVMSGLSPLEVHFVECAGTELTPLAGAELPPDALHVVLAGTLTSGGRTLARGECFGAGALIGQHNEPPAVAGERVSLLRLDAEGLAALGERHPRLGVRLYRNLAQAASRC